MKENNLLFQFCKPGFAELESTRFQSLIVKKDDSAFNLNPCVCELDPLHRGSACAAKASKASVGDAQPALVIGPDTG